MLYYIYRVSHSLSSLLPTSHNTIDQHTHDTHTRIHFVRVECVLSMLMSCIFRSRWHRRPNSVWQVPYHRTRTTNANNMMCCNRQQGRKKENGTIGHSTHSNNDASSHCISLRVCVCVCFVSSGVRSFPIRRPQDHFPKTTTTCGKALWKIFKEIYTAHAYTVDIIIN